MPWDSIKISQVPLSTALKLLFYLVTTSEELMIVIMIALIMRIIVALQFKKRFSVCYLACSL